jgi:Mg-chelatase subunit ChlD
VSFVVAAALGVAALLFAPAVAHLLRRGRARELAFPPAALVPNARSTAREKRRIEDRLLLALRVLAVLLLALLGATPLVECERVSLSRNAGASVALALVVDDSLSMRAELPDGETRFARALTAAEQLLSGARPGDSVAIVLAGSPARVALATTNDLGAVRRTLAELRPSDRSTDLAGAVTLARATLAEQPHHDKRVVVLSDLAGEPLPDGQPAAWVPVPEIASPVHDCAITSAARRGRNVNVEIACTTPEAATGRSVLAIPLAGSGVDASEEPRRSAKPEPKDPVAQAALAPRAGLQVVVLEAPGNAELAALLGGDDAIPHDDVAPVSPETTALSLAVVADPVRASAKTGGPTLIEQAARALDAELDVRPLSVVPEHTSELEKHTLLLLDDPPGLAPEARVAIAEFVERGGVAVALIGPNADSVQLGSTLEPFLRGAVRWDTRDLPDGVDAKSIGWLGAEAPSLAELSLRGRARLDAADLGGSQVLGRFTDEKPWLVERELGRGAIYALGLPSSVEESDFALRPGFLALLDHFVTQATRRSGPKRSLPGAEWALPDERAKVTGPEGPVPLRDAAREKVASPDVRGLYRVSFDKTAQSRSVVLDPSEVLAAPRTAPRAAAAERASGRASVDVSGETALALVALLALELLLRVLRYRGARRASPA